MRLCGEFCANLHKKNEKGDFPIQNEGFPIVVSWKIRTFATDKQK